MKRTSRAGRLPLALALAAAVAAAGPPAVWAVISATLLTKGTLADGVDVNHDRIRLKTKDPTDVHVQEARFGPGDQVDWHNHPGLALIAVKSGTMTFYDEDCTPHVVGPGQSIVEAGGPTRTVNHGSTDALIYVTYVVPETAARTVLTDPPDCA